MVETASGTRGSSKKDRASGGIETALLTYYGNEASVHVTGIFATYFGMYGIIYALWTINRIVEISLLSIAFWILIAFGEYLYARWVYYGKLCEEVVFSSPELSDQHLKLRASILKYSRTMRWLMGVREPNKRASVFRAWIPLNLAIVIAILLWVAALLRI